MNQSEIAEKAAREIARTVWHHMGDRGIENAAKEFVPIVERAIAESRQENLCGTANADISTNGDIRPTVTLADDSKELLSKPQRIVTVANASDLEAVLNEPEPNVEVMRDGSCRPIAESQAPQPATKLDFECGCFMSFFAVDSEIRSALACCSNHEIPNISIAHFTASLKYRHGIVLTSECDLCGTRIRRKIPEEWVHCNPRKQNYNMRECSVKQAAGHSTVPKATSWTFKNPRIEP